MRAGDTWVEGRGAAFGTYAWACISTEIRDHMRFLNAKCRRAAQHEVAFSELRSPIDLDLDHDFGVDREHVEWLLGKLRPRMRRFIRERFLHGRKFREIAADEQCTLQNVQDGVKRGLLAMRAIGGKAHVG